MGLSEGSFTLRPVEIWSSACCSSSSVWLSAAMQIGHGIRIDAHGFTSKVSLLSLIHAKVDSIQKQEVHGRDDVGRRLIRRLILDEVRRFFVERYTGDASV